MIMHILYCIYSSLTSTEKDETTCTEGESWRDDCNICRCSNGLTLCTKKACPVVVTEEQQCQGGM